MKFDGSKIMLTVDSCSLKETVSKKTGKKGVVCILRWHLDLPDAVGTPESMFGWVHLTRLLPNDGFFQTVQIAYPHKGDVYNLEVGKKVARAKAEMTAYSTANGEIKKAFNALKAMMTELTEGKDVVYTRNGEQKTIHIEGFSDKVVRVREMNRKYLSQF